MSGITWICNLPRLTEFALKLRINSVCLSQSESSNFSQCVITLEIVMNSLSGSLLKRNGRILDF